jgi:cysteine desulfurase
MNSERSRIYLDHNATAPLRPQALEAMRAALALAGNPSSVHAEGRAARSAIEAARHQVAALTGTPARALTFTSGGTEAANLVLTPSLRRAGLPLDCDALLVSAGEHPCVLGGHRFEADRVRIVPLDAKGRLDLGALAALLAAGDMKRPMLALQAANNETGVLQPIAEAAALVHAAEGLLVSDAVQFVGRMPSVAALAAADVLIVSGHKMGGPKGVGALAFRHEDLHIEHGLVRGGGQERGLRAGTENVAAIAGFGAAAAAIGPDLAAEAARLGQLRDDLERDLSSILPDLVIFGRDAPRLVNTSAFALPGLSAETLLMALDLDGIAVSSGSACSSGKVRPSHVLQAMGVADELARGALRISLGWTTTQEDVKRFCETFQKTIRNISERRRRPAA